MCPGWVKLYLYAYDLVLHQYVYLKSPSLLHANACALLSGASGASFSLNHFTEQHWHCGSRRSPADPFTVWHTEQLWCISDKRTAVTEPQQLPAATELQLLLSGEAKLHLLKKKKACSDWTWRRCSWNRCTDANGDRDTLAWVSVFVHRDRWVWTHLQLSIKRPHIKCYSPWQMKVCVSEQHELLLPAQFTFKLFRLELKMIG